MSPTPHDGALGRLKAWRRTPVLSPVDEGDEAARSLIEALEASPRFRRDGRIGRIFHPGRTSYRELTPTNSLHVIVGGGRVSAHVDDVCPLRCSPDGSARYSWIPVLRHNISGMVADVGRRIQGSHGHQRCNLTCESVWVDDEEGISNLVRAAGSGPSEEAGCSVDQP